MNGVISSPALAPGAEPAPAVIAVAPEPAGVTAPLAVPGPNCCAMGAAPLLLPVVVHIIVVKGPSWGALDPMVRVWPATGACADSASQAKSPTMTVRQERGLLSCR